MQKYILRALVGLIALGILSLFALCLASCATVQYSENGNDENGNPYTAKYSATKLNPFGKTDSQSESFTLEYDGDGRNRVTAGQALENQNNEPAGLVAVQILELLLPLIAPPVVPLDPLPGTASPDPLLFTVPE